MRDVGSAVSSQGTFVRWCGLALASAGALTIIVNAVVTPLMPRGGALSLTAVSTPFLVRQSLAAAAALCLVLGAAGLYLRQSDRLRSFGAIAFALAFAGSVMLFAVEWTQLFDVRDLARRSPETLDRLDAAGVGLDDIGAMIALAVFAAGWIALAIATIRGGVLSRRAAWLVIAGLFATPFLSAALPPVAAGAAGNALLGTGWIWLGYELRAPVHSRRSNP